jgi:hypothetical protein
MHTNVWGLVKSLQLGQSKGMIPLYEAISNAIDAIDEMGLKAEAGKVDIHLVRKHDLASGSNDIQPIDGFTITDNGIGFTQDHITSFKEAYTTKKLKAGGKGVGRFTFLKVFDEVSVSSVFHDGSGKKKRTFSFSVENEVFAEDLSDVASTEATGTTVSVKLLDEVYRSAWAKESEVISQRIVDHFLSRFAAKTCPTIRVLDEGHEPIILQKLFTELIKPHFDDIAIHVGPHQFNTKVFRSHGARDKHELSYCAIGREVTTSKLRDLIPALPEKLLDEEKKRFALKVLVTGDYLDSNANNERTEIVFNDDDDENLANASDRPSRMQLDQAIASRLRDALENDLKSTNETKLHDITNFVEQAPEYQVLLNDKYRAQLERDIPPGCSNDKLDEHLLHFRRRVEDDVRKQGKKIAELVDKESFDQYESRMNDFIETMNEVGKSQLASYIAHRRAILDLLDVSLKKSATDKNYKLEEILHNMIFPMRQTSRDVFQKQQNLWIIDERLCFHSILTSDKKLKSISGMKGTSGKEPDILAFFYDHPVGIQEAEDSSGAIVIIEFKRPGRNDYKADPAQQVIQRFVEIKNGNVRDIDGRPINATNIRFFGYLIADLTESLKFQMEMNYHPSMDGEGYFKTLTTGNGYIEIISYKKLLDDAKRRNRVLFEKLGLHKN